jgi:hypothetical protein
VAEKHTTQDGAITAAATWGGTLPGTGDDCFIEHTCTLSAASVQYNSLTIGGAARGQLSSGNGFTLTCPGGITVSDVGSWALGAGTVNADIAIQAYNTPTGAIALEASASVAINGDVLVGAGAENDVGIFIPSGSMSTTITGDVTGPHGNMDYCAAIRVEGGTLNVVGDVYGGGADFSACVHIVNGGSVTVTGNVYSGTNPPAYGVWNNWGSLEVQGDAIGVGSRAVYTTFWDVVPRTVIRGTCRDFGLDAWNTDPTTDIAQVFGGVNGTEAVLAEGTSVFISGCHVQGSIVTQDVTTEYDRFDGRIRLCDCVLGPLTVACLRAPILPFLWGVSIEGTCRMRGDIRLVGDERMPLRTTASGRLLVERRDLEIIHAPDWSGATLRFNFSEAYGFTGGQS